MKYITKTVWLLSFISLFTDLASEMLYPIMPAYLKSIGFSVLIIGILEGLAEAIAGLSKGYFGKLSDTTARRVPFVQLGYLLSALSKPLMGAFVYPVWIFFARTIDRLGKGIRTGARDAILSDEATKETKGKVFGFHRSMDTLGAVIGPLFALVYLYFNPGQYRILFFIAIIPGALSIIASFMLKDKKGVQPKSAKETSFFAFIHYWKTSPVIYRKVASGLLVFTLFNSSDLFLLMKVKESGLNDTEVIGIYIFYNLIFALFAYPMGILADKIGLKKVVVIGLILFSTVYFGMALSTDPFIYVILFFLYGLYAAATDGIGKAWITNITYKKDTATAIGTYAGFQSICAMLASSLAGGIWYYFGFATAFMVTSSAVIGVVIYFLVGVKPSEHEPLD